MVVAVICVAVAGAVWLAWTAINDMDDTPKGGARLDHHFQREVNQRLGHIENKLDHLINALRADTRAVLMGIVQEGEVVMAKIDDAVAAVDDAIDAETARVVAKQDDLAAQIAALQAQVDAGGASQATLDRLAAMKVKLDAIDPATPTTVPTP